MFFFLFLVLEGKKADISDNSVDIVDRKKSTIARTISTRLQNQVKSRDLLSDPKSLKTNNLTGIKTEKKNSQQLGKLKNAAKIATKKSDITVTSVNSVKRNQQPCKTKNEVLSSVSIDSKIDAAMATCQDQVQSVANVDSPGKNVARPNTSPSTTTPQPLSSNSEFQQGCIINNQRKYRNIPWTGKMWNQTQKIKKLESQVESLQNVSIYNYNKNNQFFSCWNFCLHFY